MSDTGHISTANSGLEPLAGTPTMEELRARRMRTYIAGLKQDQNFEKGLIASICVGAFLASFWTLINWLIGFHADFMPMVIAAGVAYGMIWGSGGIEKHFGYGAGAITFLAIILGHYNSIMLNSARILPFSFIEIYGQMPLSFVPDPVWDQLDWLDFILMAISVAAATHYGFRRISRAEIAEVTK